jgi:hypothetical protein
MFITVFSVSLHFITGIFRSTCSGFIDIAGLSEIGFCSILQIWMITAILDLLVIGYACFITVRMKKRVLAAQEGAH